MSKNIIEIITSEFDNGGFFSHWHIKAANGEIIACSQSFDGATRGKARDAARKAARRFITRLRGPVEIRYCDIERH